MREIKLTGEKYPNMVALVDDEDYEYLNQWKWHAAGDPRTLYAKRTQWDGGKWRKILMHVVIMQPPTGLEVDHIDGDGLNNQRSNLRVCTHAQNMQNRKPQINSRSGYLGVHRDAHTGLWRASIGVDGRIVFLGLYEKAQEAAEVRRNALLELGLSAAALAPGERGVIKPNPGYFQHHLSERAQKFFKTGLYYTWQHMLARCRNPKNKDYVNYGGRGIAVCDRWLSFDAFVEDLADGWADGLVLGRIDVDGNYEPNNCQWATKGQQNAKRRNVRLVEYQGRSLPVATWARELGVNKTLVYRHVRNGMSFPEALDHLVKRKVEQ